MKTSHWISSDLDFVPLHSSYRLWGPWFPNIIKNLLSFEKIRTLAHWARVQFFFFLCLLPLVQQWLNTKNTTLVSYFLDMSLHDGSGSTNSSLQVIELTLLDNPLKSVVIILLVNRYLSHFSFPTDFPWIWFDTALCKKPTLSAVIFLFTFLLLSSSLLLWPSYWLTLHEESVSAYLLANCQIGSLHGCVC